MQKRAFVIFLMLLPLGGSAEPNVDNERLTEIYEQDQADRRARPIDWSVVGPRDKARRMEVLELLRSGDARTANDFYHAAMIMQHGDSVEDYQLANSLARFSMTLDPSNTRARWLTAASWDRILMSKEMPQWYGTQYRQPSPGSPFELWPVEEAAVSDEEREAMNVPSLQEAKERLLQINK